MELPGYGHGSRCQVCGKPARVHVGTTAYCLDCYNNLADYLYGVKTPTNDSFNILALDSEGRTVEFAVERYAHGTASTWTAVELVDDDDSRRADGYVGRSVSIVADARVVSQEEALDALMVKVQRVVGKPSLHAHIVPPDQVWDGPVQFADRVIYANETGMARVDCDEQGRTCFVIDGQRFSAEQFAALMSAYEGFDLYWRVGDVSDEPLER